MAAFATGRHGVAGVGFVFADDPYSGIDLDDCRDLKTGVIQSWARRIIQRLNSYTKISPSGTGVKIWVRAKLSGDRLRNRRACEGGEVEMYSRGRYFTVTSQHLEGTPFSIESRQVELDKLHRELFPEPSRSNGNHNHNGSRPDSLSDRELIDKAIAAKNGAQFTSLWNGDASGYASHSEADLALCTMLAFWSGKDSDRIDALFRQSGLMRKKWERADYRQRTIAAAIERTQDTYTPHGNRGGTQHHHNSNGNGGGNGTAKPEDEDEDDERPQPTPSLKNAVRGIVTNHLAVISYDEFLRRPITGAPSREWTDADDLELTIKLQHVRGFAKIGLDTVRNAALTIAFRNRKNCVKDWLESLKWDKEDRIGHFFEDHFGAPGTDYTRSASKNFWLSMVARVDRPGCQVDHMIVLEGPQGIGKSAALRIIGGDWFAEQHESASSKDFFEVLQGKLLVEISEMDSFSRAEVTKVKQIVTCTNDRFRDSYGRHARDHPRQCIFVATTNRDDWNRDETGARRFWPIACTGEIDLQSIRTHRNQLFAEAVYRYKNGEKWYEMPAEQTFAVQQARYAADVWIELIEPFIRAKAEVTCHTILVECLKFEPSRIQKGDQMRVATCLGLLGWRKHGNGRIGNHVTKVWKPPDEM